MIAWWAGRSRREQVLVGVMLAALALFVLWFAIVAPLGAAARSAEQRFARAVQAEQAVGRTLAAIALVKSSPPPKSSRRPLDLVVNETAAAAGVELGRVEPDPASGLRVAAPSVAPNVLFPWLSLLQREHGIVARHLTVLKNDTGGLTLDATLVRAGA